MIRWRLGCQKLTGLLPIAILMAVASFSRLAEGATPSPNVQALANAVEAAARHLYEDVDIDLSDSPVYEQTEAQARDLLLQARHLRKAAFQGADPDHLQTDVQKVGEVLTQLQQRLARVADEPHLARTAQQIGLILTQLEREIASGSIVPGDLQTPRSPISPDDAERRSIQRGDPNRSRGSFIEPPCCPDRGPPRRLGSPAFDDFVPQLAPMRRFPEEEPAASPGRPPIAPPKAPATKVVVPQEMKGIAQLPQAEQAAALAQRICPVTEELLGSHGKPLKVQVAGRTVYVCCAGCVSDLKSNPEKYLSQLDRAK